MGILSNFGSFYHTHSPNMVMSRAQVANFDFFFLFCPNSTFNIKKIHKISGDTPPPVSLGLIKPWLHV